MSLQKYDFVGVSATQLPYVHDSFPAGSRISAVKYNTMRSVQRSRNTLYRGPTEPSRNELDLRLPQIQSHRQGGRRKNGQTTSRGTTNVERQKAYFRLKGIPLNQVYSLYRAKTDRYDHDQRFHNGLKDTNTSLTSLWKDPTILQNELTSLDMADTNSSRTSEYSEYVALSRRSRLQEMDRESPVPGILPGRKSKARKSRKLGNIVSSKRLQQLLDSEDPLDPDAFYHR